MPSPARILLGHKRTFIAALIGIASFYVLPLHWSLRTRLIGAWDIGAAAFLLLCVSFFVGATTEGMEANAERQQEGEWTLFWLVVGGATASFAIIVGEFGGMKDAAPAVKDLKVAMVAATLAVSWFLTHMVFALRYAHEFYTRTADSPFLDGGLEFPREPNPDYWDFFYFAAALGMTFQVSVVQPASFQSTSSIFLKVCSNIN